MITTAVTAFIAGILALMGIAPSPWLLGAIWLGVKAIIVVGAFALAARGFKKNAELPAAAVQPAAAVEGTKEP